MSPRSFSEPILREPATLRTTDPLEHGVPALLDSASPALVAEIFLHHRVLIVPVTEAGRVTGVITRSDFFRSVAERFLAQGPRD